MPVFDTSHRPGLDWAPSGGSPLRKVLYLLILMPGLLFADEVYLKGGAKFTGRIVEQTDTMVTIDIGDGVVGVTMSRVERIVKGSSALDEYDQHARNLRPDDIQSWRNLGRWALGQGLSAQSRQAYQTVLAIDPNDAEARQALGFVLIDGRWLTEEEGYRARGFVKYDGEWMTPAEVQLSQASDAAFQAREDAENRARDADVAAMMAEAQAAKAAEEAKWEEETDNWNSPVYWGGGWGYGMTAWPSTAEVKWKQPAMHNPKPSYGAPK